MKADRKIGGKAGFYLSFSYQLFTPARFLPQLFRFWLRKAAAFLRKAASFSLEKAASFIGFSGSFFYQLSMVFYQLFMVFNSFLVKS